MINFGVQEIIQSIYIDLQSAERHLVTPFVERHLRYFSTSAWQISIFWWTTD